MKIGQRLRQFKCTRRCKYFSTQRGLSWKPFLGITLVGWYASYLNIGWSTPWGCLDSIENSKNLRFKTPLWKRLNLIYFPLNDEQKPRNDCRIRKSSNKNERLDKKGCVLKLDLNKTTVRSWKNQAFKIGRLQCRNSFAKIDPYMAHFNFSKLFVLNRENSFEISPI